MPRNKKRNFTFTAIFFIFGLSFTASFFIALPEASANGPLLMPGFEVKSTPTAKEKENLVPNSQENPKSPSPVPGMGGAANKGDGESNSNALKGTGGNGLEKVKICHATGNPTNPYIELEVSFIGLDGHANDKNDLIPAPAGGCPKAAVSAQIAKTSANSTVTATNQIVLR